MQVNRLTKQFLLLTIIVFLSSASFADEINWQRFKTRFISEEGRVIDTGNGHISHSEGQGLGMLLSVAHNDHETFNKIWKWTSKNLDLRDDGLFVWRWVPGESDHTKDLGSASDGDVLIAWAMARAANKWKNAEYVATATRLAKNIRTQLITEIYGDTFILPGPVWPRRDGYIIINLSYWIYPAFQELSILDPSPQWEKLISTGIELMSLVKFGKWELPSDWFAIKTNGTVSKLDNFPFVFGYEAVRIPLNYLWGGYKQKDVLRIYQTFWSSTAKGNKLVTILGLALDSIIQQENVLAYRVVNELIECGLSQKPVDVLSKSFSDYEDYYSAALFLIGQLIVEEQMPYCQPQQTHAMHQSACDKAGGPDCPIADPIHAKIEIFDLIVRVEDFIQVPSTGLRRPLVRINFLINANDGTNRLFIVNQDGRIYIIKNNQLISEPFLDLVKYRKNSLYSEKEMTGLRALAFHPNFNNVGESGYQYLYTVHSETVNSEAVSQDVQIFYDNSGKLNHYDVISEWRIDPDDKDKVLLNSQRELMRLGQPGIYNSVGHIGFDPGLDNKDIDFGLLYIGSGSGGNVNTHNSQKTNNLFGKILRIDPQPGRDNGGYLIPDTNPYSGNHNNILPELWAHGLANPHYFSWDSKNNFMYIIDSSGSRIVEVNLGQAGANYGHGYREGMFAVKIGDNNLYPIPKNDELWEFTYPLIQYDHDEGVYMSSGFIYRGKLIPELYGKFIFCDKINGRIFYTNSEDMIIDEMDMSLDVSQKIHELRLIYKGAEKNILEILNYDSRADLSLGSDEQGEIYLVTQRDGMIRKLLPLPDGFQKE